MLVTAGPTIQFELLIPPSTPGRTSDELDRRDLRVVNGQTHQIFAPDDRAVEHLTDLVDDLFAQAGAIDLCEQMRQDERLDARALRDQGVVAVIAARRAVGG